MYDNHWGVDIMFPGRSGEPASSPDGVKGARHWVMPSGAVAALAAGPGTVTKAGWTNTGYRVTIDHPGPWSTGYMHLSRLLVRKGQKVRAGDPVGVIGFSPWKRGCKSTPSDPCKVGLNHLHFELYRNNAPVDPEIHLGQHLESLKVVSNPLGFMLLVKLGLVGVAAWGFYKLLR